LFMLCATITDNFLANIPINFSVSLFILHRIISCLDLISLLNIVGKTLKVKGFSIRLVIIRESFVFKKKSKKRKCSEVQKTQCVKGHECIFG
jgi:hypothetical protein